MDIMKYVIFFLFIFTVTFGLIFSYHPSGDVITPCPFMGESNFCAMNLLEHLSQWSLQFASVIKGISDGIPLLLIGFFVFTTLPKYIYLLLPWDIQKRSLVAKMHDYIIRALSDGILHSRIYA